MSYDRNLTQIKVLLTQYLNFLRPLAVR